MTLKITQYEERKSKGMNKIIKNIKEKMNKLLCLLLGHIPLSEHKKDMFGYEYVWQKIDCERCGKRLN